MDAVSERERKDIQESRQFQRHFLVRPQTLAILT